MWRMDRSWGIVDRKIDWDEIGSTGVGGKMATREQDFFKCGKGWAKVLDKMWGVLNY